MTKPPRPSLDSLSDRFARKPAVSPAAAPEPEAPSAGGEAPPVPPKAKKDDRVQILTRIDAPTRKRLRLIALEQDRTVQEICEEAIRDFVARHSK